MFKLLFFTISFALTFAQQTISRDVNYTCLPWNTAQDRYYWQFQIETDTNGKVLGVTGLNGLELNLQEDEDKSKRTDNGLPLVVTGDLARGTAVEIMDADTKYCSSFVNSATVNMWGQFWTFFLYLLALFYFFLGVSIIADVFMTAIEVITSQTHQITRVVQDRQTNKEVDVTIEVRVWNETVANLTLLALGSSAPEILLSVIDTVTTLGEPAGELGPSTIVGSAAFNLFMISAICAISVPDGEERRLSQFGVFLITAFASVFAYIWMLICIIGISYEVVDVFEAFLTFLFFPILVGVAYAQDVDLFSIKEDEVQERVRVEIGFKEQVQQHVDQIGDLENVDKKKIAQQVGGKILQKKSPLWWRINGARMLAGKKPMVKPGQRIDAAFSDAEAVEIEMMEKKDDTSTYFNKNKITQQLVNKTTKTQISFVIPQYSVLESEGSIKIPVVRVGDLSGTDFIDYHTIDGTAEAGDDYEEASGTLKFAPNEDTKFVEVVVIHDDKVEDNEFFAIMLANPAGQSVSIGETRLTSVIIVDVSSPGEFMFIDHHMSVSERAGELRLLVRRVNGCQDRVTVNWSTRSGMAIVGKEYGERGNMTELSGTLVFENQEVKRHLSIPILDNRRTEGHAAADFNILLSNPTNRSQIKSENGKINIRITDDEKYTGIINDILGLALGSGLDVQTHSWRQQFIDALAFEDGDTTAMVMHAVTVPWKIIFACIPPTSYYGGWLTFVCSLTMIGAVTAIIGELATMWGCFMNISDGVVAMTIVALGTSMPDTFASITATQMAEDADAAIGNITGSNSVNVFLGLGLPWLIASIYAEAKSEVYVVPKGTIATSVLIFSILACLCLGLMIYREIADIGVLGGTSNGRKMMAIFFTVEWFIFILITILEDSSVITILA